MKPTSFGLIRARRVQLPSVRYSLEERFLLFLSLVLVHLQDILSFSVSTFQFITGREPYLGVPLRIIFVGLSNFFGLSLPTQVPCGGSDRTHGYPSLTVLLGVQIGIGRPRPRYNAVTLPYQYPRPPPRVPRKYRIGQGCFRVLRGRQS